jgi:hypothetical protein
MVKQDGEAAFEKMQRMEPPSPEDLNSPNFSLSHFYNLTPVESEEIEQRVAQLGPDTDS